MRCSGLITRTDKRQGPRVLGIASEFHLSGMRYLGSRVLGFGFGVYIHIYIYTFIYLHIFIYGVVLGKKEEFRISHRGCTVYIYIYVYVSYIGLEREIYICICICMYVCMYYMYIYIYMEGERFRE